MSPILKTLLLILLSLSSYVTFCSSQSGVKGSPEEEDSSHDFIIVGGGLSGCVVGGRLSEKYGVLILEAGGEPDEDDLNIPAKVWDLVGNESYTKVYKSVGQTKAGLGNNGVIDYRIGKVLGGGSSINGMIYNRGSPHDYDNWANLTDDQSWNYTSLLGIFKKIEDYHGKFPNDKERGHGGPIPIESSLYAPGLNSWLDGGKKLGYSTSGPNGPQKIGFSPLEFTRRQGKRVSAFTGYVKPFLESRPNLKIIQHATVKKILFEKNGEVTRAVGVTYVTRDGETKTVKVKKEVIVSAGTMDSTGLLLKSGIGPEDVLKAANIDPVKVLPVGYNLQDHVYLKLDFTVARNRSEYFDPKRDLTSAAWRLFEKMGDGPYSSSNGAHGQAFLASTYRQLGESPNPNWPDIQLVHVQSPAKLGLLPEEHQEEEEDPENVTISTMVALVRPKSVGRVTLDPNDIDGQPLIDFQYLTHPDDLEILVEAIKTVFKLYEDTKPFQKLGALYSKVPHVPCSGHQFRSDEYWRCFISHVSGSGIHAGGTCRMGRGKDDPNAVVDPTLKVIGVDHLRVVDLSIMPTVTNANTQAVAYVIAEKASEMILKEWQDDKKSVDMEGRDKSEKDEL